MAGLRVRQEPLAGDAEDLPDAGPAQLLLQLGIQFRGGLDGPVFTPAVALVPLLMKPPLTPPLPALAGGKRPHLER